MERLSKPNNRATTGNDPEKPVPCEGENCPFWGVPSRSNLCSQCHKEKLKDATTIIAPELAQSPEAAEAEFQLKEALMVKSLAGQEELDEMSSSSSKDKEGMSMEAVAGSSNDFSNSVSTPSPKLSKSSSRRQSLTGSSRPQLNLSLLNKTEGLPSVEELDDIKDEELSAMEREEEEMKKRPPPPPIQLSTAMETEPLKRVQKDKRRCLECNKFIGFTGIKCQCGYVFCGQHRYPEKHQCEVDFDARARDRYFENRPKPAVADKIGGERL